MAKLPKIDSEGLRLAKKVGAERVESVTRVSKEGDIRTPMERSTENRKYLREEDCEDNDEGA